MAGLDPAIHALLLSQRRGLLRGACHRAALRADPLARNDDGEIPVLNFPRHCEEAKPTKQSSSFFVTLDCFAALAGVA
jgi:hypothetical protein